MGEPAIVAPALSQLRPLVGGQCTFWATALVDHAQARGIRFASTGFDHESITFLEALGIDFLMVPSGEITNLPYLRAVGRTGMPLIVSTGMCTIEEVVVALETLTASGAPRDRIRVLHCNTEYPTPMEDVHLRAMATIARTYRVEVGYSDHTLGIEVPIAAVALGATIIEKHLTLDREMEGPDHAASLEPDEFAAMVKAVRNIELALGGDVKVPSPSETPNRAIARKSTVAAIDVAKGEVFTEENLAVKRPGTGVSPMLWDAVLGTVSDRSYAADEPITFEPV